MFSSTGSFRCLAFALPATLIAYLLLTPTAQATLIADVELTELTWAQPTASPVPCGDMNLLSCVTNDIQIGAATVMEITNLKARMQFMAPGVMIEDTIPLVFEGADPVGYNLFSQALPVTLTALDVSDLLGPIKATVLFFICENAAGVLLDCEFAAQVPTTTTYQSVADIPEPSALLLFLAGLCLLTALWLRSDSGLAGSRPGATPGRSSP